MAENISQGPRAGSHWPSEGDVYDDPNTGATVRRLTGYPGAGSLHPYFTEPCLYDDGRRMVVSSDRTGDSQVFSIDLETGLLTQLSDVPAVEAGTSSRPAIVENGEAVYRWSGDHMIAIDLETLSVRSLYEKPSGYHGKIPGVSADGANVIVSIVEDVRDRTGDDWMTEKFELGPHSKVLSIPTDGGEVETLVEVDRWIGHVNPSPTRPELLTYCEEGPWGRVDNRIWVLDSETGETWTVREMPGEGGVGHEYWLADGERVGYHGWERDSDGNRRAFAGSARYDDTDHLETEIPEGGTHTHSNTPELLVTDGSPDIPCNLLYRYDEEAGEYEGPRLLATHDWGAASPHPHSRLLPDGSGVVFDSNRYDGSNDVFLVELPPFEELPEYDGSL
ncbi:oligogalacturonate lyase family protein [Natronoglomus mannanivorans]|uniref:Oligogalacturonate lyase family protein n=1 Tax=Natronoglomus mannanivorans TaxID=2979990 RepID=A0AAP2Z0R1_9EURY|nr:oligogalacturonate lyase family protein [Halobacteria archaeon AArc-xg1-1]